MPISLKLIHHYKDIIDHWDGNPFQDVEEAAIDEKTHTIKNACVFGTRHSKNGYTYQDGAINSLVKFTEGAKFFINHPSKSETKERDGVRDIRDWAGVYSNPRKIGPDKVLADLTVRPAFWELVKDVATMKPVGIGNSINSRVKVFKDNLGKEHVVDIDVLKSIDLVASAATTQNLFESAMDKAGAELSERVEAILTEGDSKTQGNMVYQLLAEFTEGILLDKLKEREVARKVSDLNWKASDLIDAIIRDAKKDMKIKKTEVTSILEDLDKEITLILSGKSSTVKGEGDGVERPTILSEQNKEDEMDFTKLTLEELGKERPDLVKAIKDTMEDSKKRDGLEKENTDLKKANEDLVKTKTELEAKLEELTKELNDVKLKLDEFEAKDKLAKKEAFIASKIEELKVPKDVITDFFRQDLMLKEEKEIEEALKDRRDLLLKTQGKIKNAGEEYKPGDDTPLDEKKKQAAAKLEAAKQ